MSNIANTL